MSSRISLSIGIYSQVPYVIPGIEIPVYCIEELCVAFRENAVLIDEQIMNKSLIEWIYRDLSLRELADSLLNIMNRRKGLGEFCRYILEYTGLFDKAAIIEICRKLTMGAGMSTMERQKKQADSLAESGNYEQAVHAYRNIIDKWNEKGEERSEAVLSVMGNIYNNLGFSYAGMMKYTLAAEAFRKAYECDDTPEHRTCYIAALRLSMRGPEFVRYIGMHHELGPDSIKIDQMMDSLGKEYEVGGEGMLHQIMKNTRAELGGSNVSADNEHILEMLKNKYRSGLPVN